MITLVLARFAGASHEPAPVSVFGQVVYRNSMQCIILQKMYILNIAEIRNVASDESFNLVKIDLKSVRLPSAS